MVCGSNFFSSIKVHGNVLLKLFMKAVQMINYTLTICSLEKFLSGTKSFVIKNISKLPFCVLFSHNVSIECFNFVFKI